MKFILILIAFIISGAFVFGIQSSRLKGLREENQSLSERTSAHTASSKTHATQNSSKTADPNLFPGASTEEANSFGTELTDLMALALEVKDRGELNADFEKRHLQLLQTAQNFSPENIQTVMDIIRADSRFDDSEELVDRPLLSTKNTKKTPHLIISRFVTHCSSLWLITTLTACSLF